MTMWHHTIFLHLHIILQQTVYDYTVVVEFALWLQNQVVVKFIKQLT